MLGAGLLGVRSHDLARLCQFVLVPLLPNKEAYARRHLPDAVTDRKVEGVDFKNDFLEVCQLFSHNTQMIPVEQLRVQPPRPVNGCVMLSCDDLDTRAAG
jgi:hypothetical protein